MTYLVSEHRYVVCGLGLTGQACVRFLLEQNAYVKAFDTRENLALKNADDLASIGVLFGQPNASFFDDVDTLILSPGVSPLAPAVQEAKRCGLEIIGDVELFARLNKTPCIGVTGSNGKTTVTLLTTHILNTLGKKAVAAGNVGKPVLETLGLELDVIVLELSSFQLEMTSSLALQGATLLNLSEDHLDRHGSLEGYGSAKQGIFAHCEKAAVWRDHAYSVPQHPVAEYISYGLTQSNQGFGVSDENITYQGKPLLTLSDIPLAGEHNVLNVMAALALCESIGEDLSEAAIAVKSFETAPHRCVELGRFNGVRWIDDSKATNVGATIAAIEGIAPKLQGQLHLIAGGDAKGADLSPLAPVFEKHVKSVFALGKDAHQIALVFPKTQCVTTMKDAVVAANNAAVNNDVVMLSPACASIDMFNNYIERAQAFKAAIMEVQNS